MLIRGVSLKNKTTTAKARIAANTSEWLNPRCPKKSRDRIPKKKAITSASGNIEQITESSQNLSGALLRANTFPSARATIPCEIMVGKMNLIADLEL